MKIIFNKNIPLIIFIFLFTNTITGQEYLSLEAAVNKALDYQYSIRIARNNIQIAENNNTIGAAGMLPVVSLSSDYAYAIQTTEQQFFNGEGKSAANAPNENFRAGTEIRWTVFDGFKMFATRNRLALEHKKSKIAFTAAAQQLAADVMLSYFNLVRLQRSIDIYKRAVRLDRDLKQLAQNRLRIGTASAFQVLQAANQLNADSILLVQQQVAFQEETIAFRRLIGTQDDPATIQVDSSYSTQALPPLDTLIDWTVSQNPVLQDLKMEIQIADHLIDEEKSALWPRLEIFGNYNYSTTRSEVGFLLSSFNYGPTFGAGLRYNIYNGRNLKKDLQSAELYKVNQTLRLQDYQADLMAMLNTAILKYNAALQFINLEQSNVATASRNSELARELYKSGRATNYEVREALLQETRTQNRLLNARYQLKQAQVQLLYLAGKPLHLLQ